MSEEDLYFFLRVFEKMNKALAPRKKNKTNMSFHMGKWFGDEKR